MTDISQLLFQSQTSGSTTYNVSTNHPLIQSSQTFEYYKKYVSIHSEDRDQLKYPQSNHFEIELPEDFLNVLNVKLVHWTFPANYNTFSSNNGNVTMTFKINAPFNPSNLNYNDPLYNEIFNCLSLTQNQNYNILISDGFYNPSQMAITLTNKFNYVVTQRIINYLTDTTSSYYNPNTFPSLLNEFKINGGYTRFIIVYNVISQKLWFGNKTDGFILTNSTQLTKNTVDQSTFCTFKSQLPDFSDWGLPGNLGLSRSDTTSTIGNELDEALYVTINGIIVPRFYYGDVTPGDDGYWLLPDPKLPGSHVNWVESNFKINLMGHAYFYMEIDGINCIDETSPYNVSPFTLKTNETNGVVNASFAKIAVPTTPISQWFDRESLPYKEFVPPAERMRRLKIKLRYHNGQLVDFGVFNYSFLLEFLVCQPQQARKYKSAMSGIPGK
jgi:hypothetical protein